MGIVCFDLDGVIADSRDAIGHCFNLALAHAGADPLPPGGIDRYIGPPLVETFREVLADRDPDGDLVPQCIATYRLHYVTESLTRTTLYPGIREVLATISATARTVVVTSKPTLYAVPILESMGLLGHFESVYGPTVDLAHEPKTETLARALEDLGTVDGPVLMVGDRSHDVVAAIANGAIPVGVLWGFGSRHELEDAGARHIASTPGDLVGVVRNLVGG